MNESNIRELDLENFIKRMLKDDLPPEAAARMSRHFFHFERMLGWPERRVTHPGGNRRSLGDNLKAQ